jgi:hypothetical protein
MYTVDLRRAERLRDDLKHLCLLLDNAINDEIHRPGQPSDWAASINSAFTTGAGRTEVGGIIVIDADQQGTVDVLTESGV